MFTIIYIAAIMRGVIEPKGNLHIPVAIDAVIGILIAILLAG